MSLLRLQGVRAGYGAEPVLDSLFLNLETHDFVAAVGSRSFMGVPDGS